ncbi:spermidine synthase [Vibrio albus]|nr:fused MFS/spermidine synthase [Vibrio albus]
MGMLATLLSFLSSAPAQSKVIHQQKSLYQNIVVVEEDGRRCLTFSSTQGRRTQSCQYQKQGDSRLVFPYTRMSLSGLLINPDPEKILVVGLGGGSIPQVLSELYPGAQIDIVELDPAVAKVAYDYFHFKETDTMTVTIADARVFIKRAGIQGHHYDYILLDAFNGDYIPEHLMTQEFLEETRQILTDNGVLIANTFSRSQLYAHESVTYRKVFGPFLNFKNPEETGNRVIIAGKAELPNMQELKDQADRMAKRLAHYGVSIEKFPERMSSEADWDTSARVLTDQFSPVNLLRER